MNRFTLLQYSNAAALITPLGIVEVDTILANLLVRENRIFEALPDTHLKEHSLGRQLSFLQDHLKNKFIIVSILLLH